MKENFSIGEVAQQIGEPQFRIKYALEQGKVPWQGERFGTMRVFTRSDVENLRAYFKKPKAKKKP